MREGKENYDELLVMWDIQESLLQSYRGIFITPESIILAIAATILSTKLPLIAIILTAPGFIILWLWWSICKNRAMDVSFIQWLLLKIDDKEYTISEPVRIFKNWQNTGKYKEIEVKKDRYFKELLKSTTRWKMENGKSSSSYIHDNMDYVL